MVFHVRAKISWTFGILPMVVEGCGATLLLLEVERFLAYAFICFGESVEPQAYSQGLKNRKGTVRPLYLGKQYTTEIKDFPKFEQRCASLALVAITPAPSPIKNYVI
jgi:hypothetical protein